jgi:hypothetical protein
MRWTTLQAFRNPAFGPEMRSMIIITGRLAAERPGKSYIIFIMDLHCA